MNAPENEEEGLVEQAAPEVANDDVGNTEAAPDPGPQLILRMQDRIGFGAFSTVFRNPENGRVYKLFKQRDENELDDYGDQEPVLRRAAFNSEAAAYEIAMVVDDILQFVPTFHGTADIDQVLDFDNSDISDRYLLDCCYVIGFVDGPAPAKLTRGLAGQNAHLQALVALFEKLGINHWHDAAVFHPGNSAFTKVVDFALSDAYGDGALKIALDGG